MISARVKEIAHEMLNQARLGKPVTQDVIAQIFHERDGQAFSNNTFSMARDLYEKLSVSPYFEDEDMLMRAGSAALMEMLRYLPLADGFHEVTEKLHEATVKNMQYEQLITQFNVESKEVVKKLSIAIGQLEKNPGAAGLVELLKRSRHLIESVEQING